MRLIKVAAAALNQIPLAWEHNKKNILASIEQAQNERVSILCLPELCISGYGAEDAFLSPSVHQTSLQVLHEILPHTKGIAVSLGLPFNYQNGLFNTACMVADGKILGFVAKRFLAGQGIHYEPRWFKAWPAALRSEADVFGTKYPIGDLHFDLGGIKVGFEICEDAWVATRPGGTLSRQGVDMILNPSASHFAFGKYEVRKRFVLEGSRAFGVSYLYANLLGNESGRAIYDGETMIASAGELIAIGPRFSFRDHVLTTASIDIDQTRMNQVAAVNIQHDFEGAAAYRVEADFDYPEIEPQTQKLLQPNWESSPYIKEEEFARAETLALFDYMRKSRSKGFVVSLSGGADSSSIACLVNLMIKFAVKEIGIDGLKTKLNYISAIAEAQTEEELVKELLTCAYQATRNSSDTTRNAAKGLADALNANYYEFEIDKLVEGYVGMVSKAIGRDLNWDTDDIALQNIQARVRAPSVWLLANIRGALLVATSNRSEAAVGYATMDGDTAGGLAPIGGIDKAFLRRWLVWLEKRGPEGLTNIPKLELVTAQTPTAELRPKEQEQTDEKDLMPYDILDAIERATIRDKKSPLEVFRILQLSFNSYGPHKLGLWIERFFTLWCRNQWKRERYAPSFHLDDENLDPKTWCRFPILSGGFTRGIAEMHAYIKKTWPEK